MNMKKKIEVAKQYLLDTYAQVPVVFESGEGMYLRSVEGERYLDFVGGIAVNALGYGDKGLQEAIEATLTKGVLHCSNLYYNSQAVEAAKGLCELAEMDRVFFCNSGAEANEAALKLARKFGNSASTPKSEIISMADSFHGRTYAAITATGQPKYHANFDPLPAGFKYATFNDLASVKALMSEKTCAVIVEPIQGEGGIIPADKEFLVGLRELCDSYGALLIYDEVQCGMGRSGKPFAHQFYGVKPDVLTVAKALAAGIPAGAMLTTGVANTIFAPGDHASTFGGNVLASTGINEMVRRLQDPAFSAHIEKMGTYLTEQLKVLAARYPTLTGGVRGVGLMQGLILQIPPRKVVDGCFERGLLVASAGSDVLRFVPPLIVDKEAIDSAIATIDALLATFL